MATIMTSARPLLKLIARLVITGVFVAAALPKIQDPVAFKTSVMAFQLTGPLLSSWVSLILPWLELVVGFGLLVPGIRRLSRLILMLLLLLFIGLHLYAWSSGLEISCGCFGDTDSPKTNYLWLVLRNSALFFALLWTKDIHK